MTDFAICFVGLWCCLLLFQAVWTLVETIKIWRMAEKIPLPSGENKPLVMQVVDFVNLYAIMWNLLPVILEERKQDKK